MYNILKTLHYFLNIMNDFHLKQNTIIKYLNCNSPLKAGDDLKLMSATSLTAASNTSVIDIRVKQSACKVKITEIDFINFINILFMLKYKV